MWRRTYIGSFTKEGLKRFYWGWAARQHLTEEQRERLNAMSLDEVIAALST